jgi:hypothetical protein
VKQLWRLGGGGDFWTCDCWRGCTGQPGPLVSNPGHYVSIRAYTNLKLAVFYLCHQAGISRIMAPASVSLTVVCSLRSTKEHEKNFKVTADQLVINEKDWPREMEAIHDFCGSVLEETGVLLAFVVRENVDIPPGTDPPEGYITVAEEMIARAPHGNQSYANDSMEVWSYKANINRAHDCWTYVKPAQRTKDGRRAFLLLWDHFLGATNVENIASEAEAKVGSVSYTGERNKWTWENYVQTHTGQHAVLNGFTDYGYSGIDNGTKVRKLMAGINTDTLDTVKDEVLASSAFPKNYPDVVPFYGDFIKEHNIESASIKVSDAHISRRHSGPPSVTGSDYEASYDGVVEDMLFNHAEYRTLSYDHKNELQLKRNHRGGDDNGRSDWGDRRRNGKRVCEDERKKDK